MKSIRSPFFFLSLLVLSVLQVSCVDVNAPLDSGELPLQVALEKRDTAEVKRLLAAGADLRTRNQAGRFAAEVAATPALAARLEPPYHPDDDEPLPPEIEDADYDPEAEAESGCHYCGGDDCHCGEGECNCQHEQGECSCGHHHH